MNKIKYVLKAPIKYTETETITELSFRDHVVGGDLRGIKLGALNLQDMPTEQLLLIASRLSGQTEVAMNKLGYLDIIEIGGLIGGFLIHGPGTGETVSPT